MAAAGSAYPGDALADRPVAQWLLRRWSDHWVRHDVGYWEPTTHGLPLTTSQQPNVHWDGPAARSEDRLYELPVVAVHDVANFLVENVRASGAIWCRSATRHVMSALFLMAHPVSCDHVTHPLLALSAEGIPILAEVLLG
jgi:hypothetical protein